MNNAEKQQLQRQLNYVVQMMHSMRNMLIDMQRNAQHHEISMPYNIEFYCKSIATLQCK